VTETVKNQIPNILVARFQENLAKNLLMTTITTCREKKALAIVPPQTLVLPWQKP